MIADVSAKFDIQRHVTDNLIGQIKINQYTLQVGSKYGGSVMVGEATRQSYIPFSLTSKKGRALQTLSTRETNQEPAVQNPTSDYSDIKECKLEFASLSENEQRLALTLAAFNNTPLSALHLSVLSEVNDITQAISNLQKRKWIKDDGSRIRLLDNRSMILSQLYDLTPLKKRAFTYFTRLVEKYHSSPSQLVDDIAVITTLTSWTSETFRWKETIHLAKLWEPVLIFSRDWDGWRKILEQVLEAAKNLKDQSIQAWAHHQLGTLSLCRDEKETARSALNKALLLRQTLGEAEAAAFTQHNLNYVDIELPPPVKKAGVGWKRIAAYSVALVVLVILISQLIPYLKLFLTPTPDATLAAAIVGSPSTITTIQTVLVPEPETPGPFLQEPTATQTPSATPIPSPTPTPCFITPPATWVTTIIQPGDTLGTLAFFHNSSIDQIIRVNCLPNDQIFAGSSLWLPPLPPTPTPTTPPPYLLISSVQLAGQPRAGNDAILVPISLAVENTGGLDANFSKVSFAFSTQGSNQRANVTFNTSNAPGIIEPGQNVTSINGLVAFSPSLFNEFVTLWVSADSEQSIPIQLSLSRPVVRIARTSPSPGGVSALLFDVKSSQWYTDISLAGFVDNQTAPFVQSWIWKDGNTTIGTGSSITYRLYSNTTCIAFDISLTVNVVYFNGASSVSESARIMSDCASSIGAIGSVTNS